MKAPEKIYLFENPIDGTPDYRWLSKRSCSDDVEYVRKDAFVDKAATWFANRYQSNGSYLNADDVEDFEKEWKEYFKYRGDVATVNIKHLAKHFFELGLKVHEEPKLTVDDIMRIDALLISMWHNKLENNSYEEVLKQFKAQKGE